MEQDEKPQTEKEMEVQGSTTDTDNATDTNEASSSEKPADTSVTAGKAAEPERQYITGIKLILVISSVTFIAFLMMLDMSIVTTAIPRITSDFHSLSDVGWYGSAYLLSNCALQPLTGKLYTQFSSKYTFLTFLGIFELGSAICGAAQSSTMLIIGRAVAGLGGSGISNGGLTIVSAVIPMEKRPVVIGILLSISQIGVIGGPLIGGVLTQYATWRWCFYINLPVGLFASILLVLVNIPDQIDRTSSKPTILARLSKLDLIGFVLFAPFAVLFLLALEWGGVKYAWNSAMIIGLFCGSGVILISFGAWEYRAGDGAMIPISVVKNRIVWSSCLFTGFFFGAVLLLSYYLPMYFQAIRGVSPSMSGVYILPGILSQMFMSVCSGLLVGKLGYYLPPTIVCGVLCAIAGGLLSTLNSDSSTAQWAGYQVLAGLGRGCGMQMGIVAVSYILPPEQLSIGMSLIVFSQTFGGAIFLTIAQTVFNESLASGLERFAPTVDLKTVLLAGATALREVVRLEDVAGVVEAYNFAINHVFYLSAGASAGTLIVCWGMGWNNIKKTTSAISEA